MSWCVVTMPQVQLHGIDMFFWVFGQVMLFVPCAAAVIFLAARSINKLLPPEKA